MLQKHTNVGVKSVPRGFLQLKKGYNFKDKDEIIDLLRTAVDDSGMSWQQISEVTGVSVSTLYKWFQGDTLRPQVPTVAAVSRLFGLKITLVRSSH